MSLLRLPQLGGLNNRNLSLHSSRGQRSKVGVTPWAGLEPVLSHTHGWGCKATLQTSGAKPTPLPGVQHLLWTMAAPAG